MRPYPRVRTTRRGAVQLGWIGLAAAKRVLARVALGALLVALAGCNDKIELQTALNDVDANEIIAALNSHGIESQKIPMKEGIAVLIDTGDISRATEVLQAAGLPRKNRVNLGDVFKKEGMISTPLEERVRYIYGLSEELESTLQQFDHVITARVHVVLPERIAPGEPIQPSSAAVFIKYRPPFDEDTLLPRIRALVASSIPGLSGEQGLSKVSVVLVPSEATVDTIQWEKIGPFRVQKSSAASLIRALLLMAVLALCGLCFGAFMALRHRSAWKIKFKWPRRENGKDARKSGEGKE